MNSGTQVYIVRSGGYETTYTLHTIFWCSKTRIEIKTTPDKVTLFTLRADGRWVESGKDLYRPRELEFDLPKVEAILADRQARRARQHEATEVQQAIEKAVAGHRNGFGHFAGSDEDLARMHAALDILTGTDNVH